MPKKKIHIPNLKKYSIVVIEEIFTHCGKDYKQFKFSLVKKDPHFIEMGYVRIEGSNKKGFETHSFLKSSLRGKGYGSLLYGIAIQYCLNQKLKIGSSYYPSDNAIRLWDSKNLNSNFVIKKWYNHNEHSFQFEVVRSKKANVFKEILKKQNWGI